MQYQIHQIRLSEAEYEMVNEEGHNSVDKNKLRIDMQFDFSGEKIGSLAKEAMNKGYYSHCANIEANDLNEVFEIGNIGPNDQIERLGRMSSVSVGDVIVDEEGSQFVVASIGFKKVA